MNSHILDVQTIREMDRLLKVVADETRLKILFSLINEKECACNKKGYCHCNKCKVHTCMVEKCVSEICKIIDCSQSLVSHQLKVLKDAYIVKTRRDGLRIYYSLFDGHIKELLNIVKEHVEEK